MGFFLEGNKNLIKIIVDMDHTAAGVDVAERRANMIQLRRAYLALQTEIKLLSAAVYKKMKETRDMKIEKEPEE